MSLLLKDIIQKFEERIPLFLQEDWDQSGLNLGSKFSKVQSVLFSYDVCKEVIDFAIQKKCQLIVSHHPFRMSATVKMDLDDYENALIAQCIKNNIALYSSHTNHDSSQESLNFYYLKRLGVKNILPLKPLDAPYNSLGLGAYGSFDKPIKKIDVLDVLKKLFQVKNIRYISNGKNSIQSIGICTGSGSSLIPLALKNHLDLFITGDVKYHQAIEAKRHDLAIADVGHFYSEKDSVKVLKKVFESLFGKELEYTIYNKLKDAFEFV